MGSPAALAIVAVAVAIGGSAGAATTAVNPAADAYVRANSTGTNFGGASSINLGGRPVSNGYLRFNVSVPSGETVTKATLRLYATQNKSSGFTVHRLTDNGWGESTISYSNAPAIGAQVAASGSYARNAYVSVDVTSLVTGSGAVSLALKRSSKTVNTFNSRSLEPAAAGRGQRVGAAPHRDRGLCAG